MRLGKVLGRYFTTVTYQGRRSGRTFSTPVGYRRSGDIVTISVMLPDAKSWWRNFLGEGGPITLPAALHLIGYRHVITAPGPAA